MKKILCLLLSVIISVLLFGCTKKQETNPSAPSKPDDVQQETPVKTDITLYFADYDVMYLHPEVRSVEIQDGQLERTILEELFKGPKSNDLQKTVYGSPKVLGVSTKDGVCTINLSSAFADNNTGGSARELFAVFSIVNSLCELDSIQRVKIDIEGNKDYPFGGHFTLIDPFEADTNMIADN